MLNNFNRNRILSSRAGWFVRECQDQTQPDNPNASRYYIGQQGQPFTPKGPGFRTKHMAWEAAMALTLAKRQTTE